MKSIVFFSFWVISFSSVAAPAPSFDCDMAGTLVEKSICSSNGLSELDAQMSGDYRSFLNDLTIDNKATAKRMQRLWLKGRGKGCNGKKIEVCLEGQYSEWILANKKGFLLAKIPLDQGLRSIRSPFHENAFFDLEVIEKDKSIEDSEKEEDYRFMFRSNKLNKVLFEGAYRGYGHEYELDTVSHIFFYLSGNGKKHMAYQKDQEYYGGRCGAYRKHDLEFVSVMDPTKSLGKVNLLTADEACGTYYNTLYDWRDNKGDLLFLELENYSFYYQQAFTEIKATQLNSPSEKAVQYYWIDESGEAFLGIPYKKIIGEVEKGIWGIDKMSGGGDCGIPGHGLSDYWRFKEIVSQYKLGFHQISYFSQKFLKPDDLKVAKKYMPLLQAGLDYLNHARQIENWEEKLIEATKKYPQIEATSNFYYSGEKNWDVNPFIAAGFYTDKNCYAVQPSSFQYASIEEWFYMFWARRVTDGNLTATEALLKRVLTMMESTALTSR